MRKFRVTEILPYVWLLFLLGTLLISAQTAYRKSLVTEEYAYACDSFGYLRMAKEIRQAASRHDAPQFKLESEQTRQLIEFMKGRNVPLAQWEEVVAPHAHHYFPRSDAVAAQYPPGTGLALAMFPEGSAVYDLNRVVILVFVLTGLLALFVAGRQKAWFAAGLAVLGLQVGLSILARIGAISFSINATLVPILACVLFALLALRLQAFNKTRLAWLAALACGVFLGFAVEVRITSILLAPGLLLLLWPRSRPLRFGNLAVPVILAVIFVGVLPVLWNQQKIAGAWYLPTYGRVDASPPTMARIEHNFFYYFGEGFAAEDNWALVYAVVGFAGVLLLLHFSRKSPVANRFDLSYPRLGLSALLMWLVPTIFFLSHAVHGLHYAMPTTFAAVALIGLGSLSIDAASAPTSVVTRKSWIPMLGIALIVLAAAGGLYHAWRERAPVAATSRPPAHAAVVLPPELYSARSWVWADFLTGTLWYYHNKPAFKIQFTDPPTRAMIFKFVFDRGDQQYLIQDSPHMQQFMDEIIQLGGTLEPKGQIDGSTYFLVHWPASGPLAVKHQA